MKNLNINNIDKIDHDLILDIREPGEYEGAQIPGIKNVPKGELLMNPELYLDKNKCSYLMCLSGGRSAMAIEELTKSGYDLVNLEGGISGYEGEIVDGEGRKLR